MSKKIIIGDMMEVIDDELQEDVRKISIFSCIIPEHKMRIVKAFRENSEIVVMTGIRCPDVSVFAMSKRDNEVSREATDPHSDFLFSVVKHS